MSCLDTSLTYETEMNFVNYQYIVLAYAVVILGTRDSEVLRTVTRSRAIMY